MTSTLSEKELERLLRKEEMAKARREREKANRVGTNLKPHLKEKVFEMAEAQHMNPRALIRILICEALEARGVNLTQLLKAWKERNPNETDEDDE